MVYSMTPLSLPLWSQIHRLDAHPLVKISDREGNFSGSAIVGSIVATLQQCGAYSVLISGVLYCTLSSEQPTR